jgi:hypothetical protein
MKCVRITPGVISRQIGGTCVVLDVACRAYFQLDPTAAAIWRAIETLGRIDLVVDACASTFGDDPASVGRDVREFIDDAVGRGLLLGDRDAPSAKPRAVSGAIPALSVDCSGIRIAGDISELRRQFLQQPFLELPQFVAPDLLSVLERAVAQGDFTERAHEGIGTEVCLASGAATSACQLVFNDPALLEVVTRIAGCSTLRCFDGRVYRLEPHAGHYDSWHSDASHDRMVGLSVNLTREAYEGGILEIRRADAVQAEHAVASAGFGSGVLFRISPQLRHRVTAVRGDRARTAYAGWFRTSPDFAGAFLRALDGRAAATTS